MSRLPLGFVAKVELKLMPIPATEFELDLESTRECANFGSAFDVHRGAVYARVVSIYRIESSYSNRKLKTILSGGSIV